MSDVFRSPLQIHSPCSSTQLCTQKLDHVDYIHELPCPPVSSQSQPMGSTSRKKENERGQLLPPLSCISHHALTIPLTEDHGSTRCTSPRGCPLCRQQLLPPLLLWAYEWYGLPIWLTSWTRHFPFLLPDPLPSLCKQYFH